MNEMQRRWALNTHQRIQARRETIQNRTSSLRTGEARCEF